MLATAATAAFSRSASIIERKFTEHDRKLLRVAFDALARQASSSCVSFPCGKLEHPAPVDRSMDNCASAPVKLASSHRKHRGRRRLSSSFHGVAIVALCMCADKPCLLLLGNASNAMAAVDAAGKVQTLDCGRQVRVIHIVSVANKKTAMEVQAGIPAGCGLKYVWHCMPDRLRADDKIDVASDLPLSAVASALGSRPIYSYPPPPATYKVVSRAVLVHCDSGHNRSPALVLAFLVHTGMSLRKAYGRVLCTRPSIDPLPPYRRALRAFEWGTGRDSTVSSDDVFQLHISELVALLQKEDAGSDKKHDVELVEEALMRRKEAVAVLLAKP